MHIRYLRHPDLTISDFATQPGQSWCLYGQNHSGINTFLKLLTGELRPPDDSNTELPVKPAIISFKLQQELYEEELRRDDSDYLDRIDPGTPAADYLPREFHNHPLIDALHFRTAMTTGFRQLSSGQNRKLLLLRAIFSGSSHIVLDSLYDGLDAASCRELDQALQQLAGNSLHLLILVRNACDIPSWCSHLGIFAGGRLMHWGLLPAILPEIDKFGVENSCTPFPTASILALSNLQVPLCSRELIRLHNGCVGYGTKLLFSGLNLTISTGDHTLVTGPNGCGKSTLLQVLTGDHPKCYANDLYVFGKKRGSGESIWELKKEMGIVSPEIHRSCRVPGTALHVVLSGLYDSIGLYQHPTAAEIKRAKNWLALIGLAHREATAFRQLDYGDQRLVLIARALIKTPPLLILDEPTQGLDAASRYALLDFLEKVAVGQHHTTIIYVSHRQDEYRTFFRQHVQLEVYNDDMRETR
jgi:molybdate transport system ATP-binding protein